MYLDLRVVKQLREDENRMMTRGRGTAHSYWINSFLLDTGMVLGR